MYTRAGLAVDQLKSGRFLEQLWVGLDVGSTTVKVAIVDPATKKLLHVNYLRHNARQADVVRQLLCDAHERFPDTTFRVSICGSAGQHYAKILGAFFVQEVIANTIVVKEFYPQSRVAIELGGQDAKVIFFRFDEASGQLVTSDMRMNGSCAGGTGAFIDQVAALLDIPIEEFEALAAAGKTTYNVSGRCGVFAKTDIQPLLNQGVSKADIALSSLHAIAKQTIGGLAQGMEIKAPVIFEGGPMTFIPTLIRVFQERLGLSDAETLRPDGAETIVAYGAALANGSLFDGKRSGYLGTDGLARLHDTLLAKVNTQITAEDVFFRSVDEKQAFEARHFAAPFVRKVFERGAKVDAWLGIDAGSTTSKFVLLDDDETVIERFYSNNNADPLDVIRTALLEMHQRYHDEGVTLNIRGAGATGYGEMLFHKAFHTDHHTVETVAHACAAQKEEPAVSFILDIGGQDMKAISINRGIVTGIVLNEACSAGCGSFVETYADSLGIAVEDIADLAFESDAPSRLGSRCTVFMNSSIITEQKIGKSTGDIMAGLCRSIIENVFTKVVRIANLDSLGSSIVVQGGAFKNSAILRALELYLGKDVRRPRYPGEMGAIGIALLTMARVRALGDDYQSSFLNVEGLQRFGFDPHPGSICRFCSNHCNRTVVAFNDGTRFITGNRCERGEILGEMRSLETRSKVRELTRRMNAVPNMVKSHGRLLSRNWPVELLRPAQGIRIGIPRVLEFWTSMPFWKTLFTALGYKVVVSKKSDAALYEQGLAQVPSDTACLPAKIVHGHVQALIDKRVDTIFMPMMVSQPSENKSIKGHAFCALIQGYPLVIDKSDDPDGRHGIPFEHPIFHWSSNDLKKKQVVRYLTDVWDVPKKLAQQAFAQGTAALDAFKEQLRHEGRSILAKVAKDDSLAVVLVARPYHSDEFVNHNLAGFFTQAGIPVITLEGLDLSSEDLSHTRLDTVNSYHARVLSAAQIIATNKNLEAVQIVSFGCGHDATLTDEMIRILAELANKQALVVKLDEGEVRGPLNIRVKSFLETVGQRHPSPLHSGGITKLSDPFSTKFTKEDATRRTILVPNLSPTFSLLIESMFTREGYKARPLPLADSHAIALGKKFVHNDICFPGQVNIGEALALLESGKVRADEVAVGLAKNCEHCRAGQYATLARKALDDAGYSNIPIITTGVDDKNMHPGFVVGMRFRTGMVLGIAVMDAIENMVRAIRPYEITPGECDEVYESWRARTMYALREGPKEALRQLEAAVSAFNAIDIDRSCRRPRVAILGEILMKHHPSANCDIERYFEKNGMEVVQPPMLDFFRMTDVINKDMGKRGFTSKPFMTGLIANVSEGVFKRATFLVRRVMQHFKLFEAFPSTQDLAALTRPLIDVTYGAGEAWLIPAEILHHASHGVDSFVILQPFGCMPNHITGRGLTKKLKELVPHIQILSLDYDPDTALANVESRLQMLVMTAREMDRHRAQSFTNTAIRNEARG